MNDNVKQVSDVVGSMLQRVKTGEISTEHGLSFLEIKYHMLLNYLINLTYVVLRKCSGKTVYFCLYSQDVLYNVAYFILGQKIEKDPSIDRLIELRTVLEKIRPIDFKLRYQIDKLVKTAVTGTTNSSDPLNFKANPNNLMSQLNNNDSEDDETSDEEPEDTSFKKKKKKAKEHDGDEAEIGKYVPPRQTAMPYDDETAAEKQEKIRDRAKKRAMNSQLVDEWKEEFLDTPVEVAGGSRAQLMVSKALKEKEKYEEDYFVRLPMTKAEQHRQKKLSTMGSLGDELTRFDGIGETPGEGGNSSKGKKRKSAGKKRGGKKKKFH